MGIFDLFGKKGGMMTLDAATLDKWPERLLRRQGLNNVMGDFLQQVERERKSVVLAAEKLSDQTLIDAVPERAQPIAEEHLPLLRMAVDELLTQAEMIDDLFLLETQQENFQESLTAYKEQTQKSRAALKEFFGEELTELNESIQGLEDAMVTISPILDEKHFVNIKEVRQLIDEYKQSRDRETKLLNLQEILMGELDHYEAKRRKHKEKITYYTARARDSKFKELLAEEEELLQKMDDIKVHGLPKEEEKKQLQPIEQRLAFLRKQMINDITAMNINEQRSFLENVKDEIRLRKKKLERVEELLGETSYETYKGRLLHALEPFDVRIEDMTTIIEPEDEDVAPQ